MDTYPEGSLWSLRRIRGNPIAFLQTLASRGDMVRFSLAGQPAFLLNHPDYLENVLVSHAAKFTKGHALQRARRLLGNGLLTAEGHVHVCRRRLVQPAFNRQRVYGYGGVMVEFAARLRERWRAGQVVDATAEMSNLTLAIVGKTLFGGDVESLGADVRQVVTLASTTLDALISLVAPRRRVRCARQRLDAIIDDLIRQRVRAGGDRGDLLSILLRVQDSELDTITDQVRDDAVTILLAGHDTIATALTWTWILLARHPDVEARLHAELDAQLRGRLPTTDDLPGLPYTEGVFAESLRLYPPAWVLARRAIEDHEVDGTPIPSGSLVILSQYLMHRDPRFYPKALVFDPDRWLHDGRAHRPRLAYFPFGAGPRSCIGEAFAWMEGVLLLATLAQRWRFSVASTDQVEIDPRITLRPKHSVALVVERRLGWSN